MRKLCFTQIWENIDHYKEFFGTKDTFGYLKRMIYSNEWGGNVEL